MQFVKKAGQKYQNIGMLTKKAEKVPNDLSCLLNK